MNKTAIKNFAVWARQKLISDITYKASLLGITENGIAEKLPQSTKDLEFYDIGTKEYAEVAGNEIAQRNALVGAIRQKEQDVSNFKDAFEYVVEEVAYTWFNRLIAIRFMEVNNYLPSGIRVLSSENTAKNEPDFVTTPFDTDLEFTTNEQDRIIQLKDENKLDELFRMLFIKQCNKLHDILPELFEKTDDYSELLLTISFTDKDGVVYRLVHDIDEDDFNVEKEGQVEIIGWMYQYYNIEPKAAVFARAKGEKITKDKIPAATQLFTPDWIVRYMVENSLGRIWIEGHPNDSLRSSWKYYIDEAEQEAQVKEKLDEIKATYKNLTPEAIKLIDPCMGSGHILVYAFDVLMQIYESYGYTQRDAARSILTNNIYGTDIDKRAYQLAYFAVMMKTRQYNRRILKEEIKPNLCFIKSSKTLSEQALVKMGDCRAITQKFIDELSNASEYGSVMSLSLSESDLQKINSQIEYVQNLRDDGDLFDIMACNELEEILKPLVMQATLLVQKYDIVVTNPPYMPVSNAGAKLNDYVKKNYPDSKTDLFAVFIERGNTMVKKDGFNCMVTMQSWMFLSSFEKMRVNILRNKTITNLMHMENMVMGIAFGTAVTVVRNNYVSGYKGTYNQIKLKDIENEQPKEFPVQGNRFAQTSTDNFSKIPGSPIAYWVSEGLLGAFETGKSLGDIALARNGMKTGENGRFVRLWWEVILQEFNKTASDWKEASSSGAKWFPYNKGGEFRKWYGNNDCIVNWQNEGEEIFNHAKADKRNVQDYPLELKFKPSASWSLVTSGQPAFRYKENNLSDIAGMSFFTEKQELLTLLGFCNSKIALEILKILAPTINFQAGDIGRLPIVDYGVKTDIIRNLVSSNIDESSIDWDSSEVSWDFKRHPMLSRGKLSDAYTTWKVDCESRFLQLKANEEELNRIFIDIYGLQDELTPDVADKNVTVHRIFDTKNDVPESMKNSNYVRTMHDEVVSLISYAVGCMFGRYSLDEDGLAYAGGDWDNSKYETFIPDEDNCIPITDEEYFEDDIVGLFCAWLKKVYGEDTLEENLEFIAKALGNKGNTSREVIRNYFLNDFIKDHIKTYQKRPIYWLFDSGKQNGFKALVYMHRWNADTTGNMRVEYLHRMQRVYEKEMERMQEIIDNSHDNKEINNATKRKEKLQKQYKETKDYDAKVAHLALSRIDIDLDDGVKVNYEKVQTADGKKMQILAKI